MAHTPSEYKLCIPLENGEAAQSKFGVVEIEPFNGSIDRASPDMMRLVPIELDGDNAITWVDLPIGQYLTRLHLPGGRLITKLIDIVHGHSGLQVRVDISRQSPIDLEVSQTSVEPAAEADIETTIRWGTYENRVPEIFEYAGPDHVALGGTSDKDALMGRHDMDMLLGDSDDNILDDDDEAEKVRADSGNLLADHGAPAGDVGKREVQRGGVRVYSRIVETPVNESIGLREEHVNVERRPVNEPISVVDTAAFKEQSIDFLRGDNSIDVPSSIGQEISSANAGNDGSIGVTTPMIAGLFPDLASTHMVLNSIAIRGYTKHDVSLVMLDQTRNASSAAGLNVFEWASAHGAYLSADIGDDIHGVIVDLASTDHFQRLPGTELVAAGQLATELAGIVAGKTRESPVAGGIEVALMTGQIRRYEQEINRGGIVLGVVPRLAEDAPLLVDIMSANSGTDISGPGSDGRMRAGTVGAAVGGTINIASVPVPESPDRLQAIKGIAFGWVTETENSPQRKSSTYARTIQGTTPENPSLFVCDVEALHGNPRHRRLAAKISDSGLNITNDPGRIDLSKFLGLSKTERDFDLRLANRGDSGVEVVDCRANGGTGYERYALGHIRETSPSGALTGPERLILARLPGLWRCVPTDTYADIHIRPVRTKLHGTLSVSVSDMRMDAILDFMQRTELNSALSLVETCASLLFANYDNPYAAAASAYILLVAPPERTPSEFNQWVANLGRLFNDIPDGCIQHAAILLQTSTASESLVNKAEFPVTQTERNLLAADLLIESLMRGLPIYRAGFKLLISSLRILQGVPDFPPEMYQKIEFALNIVNQIRLRLDVSQPFTVVDMTGLYR